MTHLFIALLLLLASIVLPLHAQTASPGAPPTDTANPASAKELVPPLVYRSPFSTYRAQSDTALIPWPKANDQVRAIGGWRVYAREAQQPNGGPAPSEPAAPQPPAGHQSHQKR